MATLQRHNRDFLILATWAMLVGLVLALYVLPFSGASPTPQPAFSYDHDAGDQGGDHDGGDQGGDQGSDDKGGVSGSRRGPASPQNLAVPAA